ncbi:MAG: hypothetical protein AB1Z98_40370 [Nannocystaceae bacterium]
MRALAVFIVLMGCRSHSESVPEQADPLGLGAKVERFTIEQRDTHTVPGTVGRLSIELGDVEGADRVEHVAIIDHKDETRPFEARTLRVGTEAGFEVDGTGYRVTLVDTDSSHLLHDTATFELSLAP